VRLFIANEGALPPDNMTMRFLAPGEIPAKFHPVLYFIILPPQNSKTRMNSTIRGRLIQEEVYLCSAAGAGLQKGVPEVPHGLNNLKDETVQRTYRRHLQRILLFLPPEDNADILQLDYIRI